MPSHFLEIIWNGIGVVAIQLEDGHGIPFRV